MMKSYKIKNILGTTGAAAQAAPAAQHHAPLREVTEDTPPDLLEGTMDLVVLLPTKKTVRMTVSRRTPMMDLLIQVATANKIVPGGHIVQIRNERGIELPYKPSTPIGALDTTSIEIVPKNQVNEYIIVKKPAKIANQPFEQTFRLQVHLPRNQLYVMRVGPKTVLGDILQEVCEQKNLDANKYEVRHPVKLDEKLPLDCRIADFGVQELRVVSRNSRINNSVSQADILALQKHEERRLDSAFKHSRSSVGDSSVSSESVASHRGTSPSRSDDSRSISPLPLIRPKLTSRTSSNCSSNVPSKLNVRKMPTLSDNTDGPIKAPPRSKKRAAPLPPPSSDITFSSGPVSSSTPVKPVTSVAATAAGRKKDPPKEPPRIVTPLSSHSKSLETSGRHDDSAPKFDRQTSVPATLGSNTLPDLRAGSSQSVSNLTTVPSASTTSLASSTGGYKKRKAPLPPQVLATSPPVLQPPKETPEEEDGQPSSISSSTLTSGTCSSSECSSIHTEIGRGKFSNKRRSSSSIEQIEVEVDVHQESPDREILTVEVQKLSEADKKEVEQVLRQYDAVLEGQLQVETTVDQELDGVQEDQKSPGSETESSLSSALEEDSPRTSTSSSPIPPSVVVDLSAESSRVIEVAAVSPSVVSESSQAPSAVKSSPAPAEATCVDQTVELDRSKSNQERTVALSLLLTTTATMASVPSIKPRARPTPPPEELTVAVDNAAAAPKPKPRPRNREDQPTPAVVPPATVETAARISVSLRPGIGIKVLPDNALAAHSARLSLQQDPKHVIISRKLTDPNALEVTTTLHDQQPISKNADLDEPTNVKQKRRPAPSKSSRKNSDSDGLDDNLDMFQHQVPKKHLSMSAKLLRRKPKRRAPLPPTTFQLEEERRESDTSLVSIDLSIGEKMDNVSGDGSTEGITIPLTNKWPNYDSFEVLATSGQALSPPRDKPLPPRRHKKLASKRSAKDVTDVEEQAVASSGESDISAADSGRPTTATLTPSPIDPDLGIKNASSEESIPRYSQEDSSKDPTPSPQPPVMDSADDESSLEPQIVQKLQKSESFSSVAERELLEASAEAKRRNFASREAQRRHSYSSSDDETSSKPHHKRDSSSSATEGGVRKATSAMNMHEVDDQVAQNSVTFMKNEAEQRKEELKTRSGSDVSSVVSDEKEVTVEDVPRETENLQREAVEQQDSSSEGEIFGKDDIEELERLAEVVPARIENVEPEVEVPEPVLVPEPAPEVVEAFVSAEEEIAQEEPAPNPAEVVAQEVPAAEPVESHEVIPPAPLKASEGVMIIETEKAEEEQVQLRDTSSVRNQVKAMSGSSGNEKVYRYSGPPTIQMGTWGERPQRSVSVKRDRDYKMGFGQNNPKVESKTAGVTVAARVHSFLGNANGTQPAVARPIMAQHATRPKSVAVANYMSAINSNNAGSSETLNGNQRSNSITNVSSNAVSSWRKKMQDSAEPEKPMLERKTSTSSSLDEADTKLTLNEAAPEKSFTLPMRKVDTADVVPPLQTASLGRPNNRFSSNFSVRSDDIDSASDYSSSSSRPASSLSHTASVSSNVTISSAADSTSTSQTTGSSMMDKRKFFQGVKPVESSTKEAPVQAKNLKGSIANIQRVFEQRQQTPSPPQPQPVKVNTVTVSTAAVPKKEIVLSEPKVKTVAAPVPPPPTKPMAFSGMSSSAMVQQVMKSQSFNNNNNLARKTPPGSHNSSLERAPVKAAPMESFTLGGSTKTSSAALTKRETSSTSITNVNNKSIIILGTEQPATTSVPIRSASTTDGKFQLKISTGDSAPKPIQVNVNSNTKPVVKIASAKEISIVETTQPPKAAEPEKPKVSVIAEGLKTSNSGFFTALRQKSQNDDTTDSVKPTKIEIGGSNSSAATKTVVVEHVGKPAAVVPPPPPPPMTSGGVPPPPPPPMNNHLVTLKQTRPMSLNTSASSKSLDSKAQSPGSGDVRSELLDAIKNSHGNFKLKKTGSTLLN